MSEDNTIDEQNDGVEVEYDMEALQEKARLLGVSFHPKTGGKKLKDKIDAHIRDMESSEIIKGPNQDIKSVGPKKTIRELEKAARKTHLVVITDNNPLDQENPTIVHGVLNAYFKIGPVIIKKDEEQYVPNAIIEALKRKTMVKWIPSINHITKKPTGNKIATTKKRYSIEYIK